MKPNNTITIVVVCDNHYLVLLAALIKSIEINHKSDEKIVIYIVEDKVKVKNKAKLENSIDQKMITIEWINMEEVIPENTTLPLDRSSYPLNIYMRLFIPSFLPEHVDKVLYLDVDMLALADVSELWKTDLGGNIVGAVVDPIGTIGNKWGGIGNYEALGLSPEAKYFNTGMLLMDISRWNENNITEQVLNCVKTNKEFANFPDQYGLNIVLYQKWKELDPLWNCFSSLDIEKPFIIHFNHRKPIYRSYDKNKQYQSLFFHYLNLTKWKGTKPIGEVRRYLKKINNVIEKLLKMPFSKPQ
jgi:lipopolysaccharide biosynthesis glycosyltransferase